MALPAAALTGGPDAYGYTFIDSDEPGGPTYAWVDILATGTQAAGGDAWAVYWRAGGDGGEEPLSRRGVDTPRERKEGT